MPRHVATKPIALCITLMLWIFSVGCDDGRLHLNPHGRDSETASTLPTTDSGTSTDTGTIPSTDDTGTDTTGVDTTTDTGTGPNLCEEGIANPMGTVCCPAECGICGGEGCSARPGGPDNCCAGNIEGSVNYCDETLPPCIIGAPPLDTGTDTATASDTALDTDSDTESAQ